MPFRILQISDCHLFADPAALLKGICTRDTFRQVLQALLPQIPSTQRLVITGDLAHDERLETYQALRDLLSDWLPKVRVLPGNHDNRAAIPATFGQSVEVVHGRNVFTDTVGDWRLMGLDTQITGELAGEIGGPQLAWLEEQLHGSRQPTVIFLHHPPVTVASEWLDKIGLIDADSLWSLLDHFPQVRAICCGHIHQELTARRGATVVLATPSTGVQFRPETKVLEVDSVPPGFRVLELEDDGSFRTRVVRVPSK